MIATRFTSKTKIVSRIKHVFAEKIVQLLKNRFFDDFAYKTKRLMRQKVSGFSLSPFMYSGIIFAILRQKGKVCAFIHLLTIFDKYR